MIIACFLSLASFPIPPLRLSNYHLVRQLFGDCSNDYSSDSFFCRLDDSTSPNTTSDEALSEIKQLSLVLVLKIFFLFLSFPLKIPKGFIFPILTIGALFGRFVGTFVKYLWLKYPSHSIFEKYCLVTANRSCIDTSFYAVLGASALLAASTHLTVTLVVILIEFTSSPVYIVPIMAVVFVSRAVSRCITNFNLFEVSTSLNDYPFIDYSIVNKSDLGTAQQILLSKKTGASARSPLTTVTLQPIKISELMSLLRCPYYSFPVLESSNSPLLIGSVVTSELYNSIKKLLESEASESLYVSFCPISATTQVNRVDLSHLVVYNIYTVSPSVSTHVLVEVFNSLGLHCVHVVTNGLLLGLITKKDLISYLRRLS